MWLPGSFSFSQVAVVPQHGHFVTAELDIGFDAVDRVSQRLIEGAARIFRRFLVRAAMGENHGFVFHG